MKTKVWAFFLLFIVSCQGWAAVGCDLNDPDRDVKRLFPSSTGYKTAYQSIEKSGGQALLKEVEALLGDEFQGLYETIDVPYTIYTIYKGSDIIGYIHGINQKGVYGGLQVFLGVDHKGVITRFYYQKLTSKKAALMRENDFAQQFIGLSWEDFKSYLPKTHEGGSEKVKQIKNPNVDDAADFYSTLRAVKKNLILMQVFVFENKERAQ
ncbi:MAG: hypothetical protein LBG61_00510 [Burkholderiales bacterium]|nr:hypothetical protein [Burkholderiales bacterium]